MRKLSNNRGYTLVELLAVIIVMISVGMVLISILVSALRGANKSQTTNEVRESGNYVISQMSKMIAFATSLDGLSDGSLDINGNLIYDSVTKCLQSDVSPTPIPVAYQYIKITSYDGGQTVFSCPANGSTSISSNSAVMLGSNFTVTNCSFICTQTNSSIPPIIKISFTLSENRGSFTEKQAQIPFETSIVVRNL